MPTPKLSRLKHAKVIEYAAEGKPLRLIGKLAGCSHSAAATYAKRPLKNSETPDHGAKMPESFAEEFAPHVVDGARRVLVLSDVHIPFHDKAAVEAAVEYGKRQDVDTVLLNGDVCDFHRISRYPHDGSKVTYQQEVEAGRQFLSYLRGKFPKADVIYKEGNHDERLDAYILSRSEALFGLVNLSELLRLENYGVEHVRDQQVIRLGKLRVIHGHEYGRGGVSAPVNAGRWLFTMANGRPAMCGHLHQTSTHVEQDIDGNQVAAWSVGCLSDLHPRYRRLSRRTNHGFAFVRVSGDGAFEVSNERVMGGKVY